ncbi:MAG TPA: hypothetical protein VFX43_04970 [Chitinophagaceae bacterium]|jgi:hypothetical protein|nr:hypothetical protein [Chitinophagaceae bacterium]
MRELDSLSYFLSAIEDDVRVTIRHIGIYAALLQYWKQWDYPYPIRAFSYEIMRVAKISSSASYHKYIRDLDDYGYIRYLPSFKRNRGSSIYIVSSLF